MRASILGGFKNPFTPKRKCVIVNNRNWGTAAHFQIKKERRIVMKQLNINRSNQNSIRQNIMSKEECGGGFGQGLLFIDPCMTDRPLYL